MVRNAMKKGRGVQKPGRSSRGTHLVLADEAAEQVVWADAKIASG